MWSLPWPPRRHLVGMPGFWKGCRGPIVLWGVEQPSSPGRTDGQPGEGAAVLAHELKNPWGLSGAPRKFYSKGGAFATNRDPAIHPRGNDRLAALTDEFMRFAAWRRRKKIRRTWTTWCNRWPFSGIQKKGPVP